MEEPESILEKQSLRLCLQILTMEMVIREIWRQQRLKERSIAGTAPARRYTIKTIPNDCIETGVEARSGGTGIDSGEAKRAPLSPNFNHGNGDQRNLETTALVRTIRIRNGPAQHVF
nr:hypothetical protein [Paenibacillus xylanexedens]